MSDLSIQCEQNPVSVSLSSQLCIDQIDESFRKKNVIN
jgi:hypothetical protein